MSDADRIRELEARVADLIENPSDAYNAMEELYDYRMLYNAMAANAYPQFSVKSRKHHDVEYCFGGWIFHCRHDHTDEIGIPSGIKPL